MVNSGQINKCQVDNFCEMSEVGSTVQKAVRNKDFKTYVNSKAVTFKP